MVVVGTFEAAGKRYAVAVKEGAPEQVFVFDDQGQAHDLSDAEWFVWWRLRPVSKLRRPKVVPA